MLILYALYNKNAASFCFSTNCLNIWFVLRIYEHEHVGTIIKFVFVHPYFWKEWRIENRQIKAVAKEKSYAFRIYIRQLGRDPCN